MKKSFIIFLAIGLNSFALADPSDKTYTFNCKAFGFKKISDNMGTSKNQPFYFHVDTSTLPDAQVCGSSIEECVEMGFEGFKELNESGKYVNYPVLVAKECLHMDSDDFIEIRAGIIPHLDKATLSIRINGDASHRIWTTDDFIQTGELNIDYKMGEKHYSVQCVVFSERVPVIWTEDVPELSHDQPIDTCN